MVPPRSLVVPLLLALVAALLVPLAVTAERPAGATPPSTTIDVGGVLLDFDYTDHTNIDPSPGTDCTVAASSSPCTGKTMGDIVRFNNVATVGSTTIDAVVTTVPSPYAPSTPETANVTRYETSSSFDRDEKFEFRVEGPNSGTAAMAGFTFAFYLTGTYTGTGTGVPVTLENLSLVIDDIDLDQFGQVSQVGGYTLGSPTLVTYQPTYTRFVNLTSNGSADEQRAVLEYPSVSSLTVYGGDLTGAESTFALTFGPATWSGSTDSTGPVVAESLAISTSTAVPAIGWSSSPVSNPAGWTAPTCNGYATTDTSFTTPLSGTLSAGVYVTHCTGGTPPAGFTVSGYTDGELVVYTAAPTVTGITPQFGSVDGGTVVTITGTGFVVPDTSVWIGGVPCNSVNVTLPTSLSCTTGARAAGTVDVLVQTYETLTSTGGTGLYTYGEVECTAWVGSNTDDVTSIDLATNTVDTAAVTIAGASEVTGLAVSPDGTNLWVTDRINDEVHRIDTATRTVIESLSVGDLPVRLAASPDGTTVWVANVLSNTVSRIDASTTPSTVSTVVVGSQPAGIAVSPDGDTVWVANSGDDSVSRIDDTTSPPTVTTISAVGDSPTGLAVSPDGATVWITLNLDDAVATIDATASPPALSGSPITVGDSPRYLAVAPYGTNVWVTNTGSNDAMRIDVENRMVEAAKTATVPNSPQGLAIAPDGTTVWITRSAGAAVQVLHAPFGAGATVDNLSVSTAPAQIAIGCVLTAAPPAAPTVSAVVPSSGSTAGGTTVTVTGTGFAAGATVTIGGAGFNCTSVNVISPTELTCVTSGAPGPGVVDVVVTVGGQASTGGTGLFTYVEPPTALVLTARPGRSATLTWTAPSGTTPVGYQIRCMPVGYPWSIGPGGKVVYVGTTTTSATVPGLTGGETYHCYVRARYGPQYFSWLGDGYEGPLSDPSNTIVVARTAPPVPVNVTASTPPQPSGQSTSVRFVAPDNRSGAPVTSFETRCTSTNGGTTRTNSGGSSPITVTNLTKGRTYTCQARSTNTVGPSPWSTATPAIVVPAGPPSGVTVTTPSAGTARITFTAPDGGPTPRSYRATCTSTNGGTTRTSTAAASPITVSTLTRTKTYTCRVWAVFDGSTLGPPSTPSNPFTVP